MAKIKDILAFVGGCVLAVFLFPVFVIFAIPIAIAEYFKSKAIRDWRDDLR